MRTDKRVSLTNAEITTFSGRFSLPLIGGIMSGRPCFVQMVPHMAISELAWNDFAFRLTLCWRLPVDADNACEETPILTVERFEVGGASLAGSAHVSIETASDFGITLFLGDPPAGSHAQDTRPELDFINVTIRKPISPPQAPVSALNSVIRTLRNLAAEAASLSSSSARLGVVLEVSAWRVDCCKNVFVLLVYSILSLVR